MQNTEVFTGWVLLTSTLHVRFMTLSTVVLKEMNLFHSPASLRLRQTVQV